MGDLCKKNRTGCCTGVTCSGNWTYFFYFIFAGRVQIFWNIVAIHCCITSSHFHIIFHFFLVIRDTSNVSSWAKPTNLCVVIHPIYLFCSWMVLWGKKLSPLAESHFHRHSVIEHCSFIITVNTEYLKTSGTLQSVPTACYRHNLSKQRRMPGACA